MQFCDALVVSPAEGAHGKEFRVHRCNAGRWCGASADDAAQVQVGDEIGEDFPKLSLNHTEQLVVEQGRDHVGNGVDEEVEWHFTHVNCQGSETFQHFHLIFMI